MAHVAEWKKEEVKELKDIIDAYDVIGLVDLENIPAKQLQEMRKSLRIKEGENLEIFVDNDENKIGSKVINIPVINNGNILAFAAATCFANVNISV